MKKLVYFLIIPLSFFSTNAQTTAEITDENTLTTVKNSSDEFQNYAADDLPWHGRRFKATAGVFFPVNNTEVEVNGTGGRIGTDIDFEKDLGFETNTVSFFGAFEWRASRRSRFNLEYFYLKRNSEKTLQKEIEFQDHTYPVDARVSAFLDNQMIRFAYGYAIISKPKYELGLLIGAHVMLADVGIGLVGNTIEASYRDNVDFTAPLPDVGIWGEFVLGKKVGLYANINYFALKINDIDGRIISYNLSVLYNVYKNFSLTAGYTGLNFRLDVTKPRIDGFFKWGYNGPTLAATYSFGNHVKFYKH
ncbi:hypothetical protein DBB36_12630 [Flavobacterium sp. WLB]|uniref:hypothetical protein n=1 Tax=unclassified Flavobacterium TaxID=196869 RepID=UPI0006ABC5DD|nr:MULTISPECIES: hypothetical protein [unclassified Flavobacterium]KOP35777.1 hypothetical protein AKO67_23650 [Flavobacterium sp. VMW]OWU92091.1 hypothetical protein APR43_02330 [Flavobacterium sp. NLM]PUU69672.1 hypothetical protein DBB36_12630 [Flavobacterium sp. WLB]